MAAKKAAASAGYSGTPLPKKLGIKEGHQLALLAAPKGFTTTLGKLPAKVTVQTDLKGKSSLDVIVLFVGKRAELEQKLSSVRKRMAPNAGLWIAWPKKTRVSSPT